MKIFKWISEKLKKKRILRIQSDLLWLEKQELPKADERVNDVLLTRSIKALCDRLYGNNEYAIVHDSISSKNVLDILEHLPYSAEEKFWMLKEFVRNIKSELLDSENSVLTADFISMMEQFVDEENFYRFVINYCSSRKDFKLSLIGLTAEQLKKKGGKAIRDNALGFVGQLYSIIAGENADLFTSVFKSLSAS